MNRILALAALLASCCFVGCNQPQPPLPEEPIKLGGLYAEKGEDGKWRVSKVLALDDNVVHLRLYANTFDEQPTELDPIQLTLESADNPASQGVGHLPMAKHAFLHDRVLVQITPVSDDELEEYRRYKAATQLPERKQESRPPK